MDAFLTTLLTTFWAEMGDRSQILCAAIAIRFHSDRTVIWGAGLATLLNCSISAFGGAVLGTYISQEPVRLFFALSLLFAGIGMLWWRRPVDLLLTWKTGAFWTSFLGLFVLQLGDKGQFIIAATAARTQSPEMALAGGWIGTMAACVLAIVLQEQLAKLVPLRLVRIIGGLLFTLAGLGFAFSAWGLFG